MFRIARCLPVRWVFVLILSIVALAASQEIALRPASYSYEIMELPLRPLAIGPSTWIAGTTAEQHAAVWNATSGLYRLPVPPEYSFSESTGVNSSGQAVGTASSGDYSRRVAFLWKDKKLSLLPGQQSSATAISENGEIVGQAVYPGAKATAPVLWKGNSIVDRHVCCAGIARSINAQDVIIGDTYDAQGHYHAFLWRRNGGEHLLSLPDEEYSSALALNSRGDILLSVTPGGFFLYTSGERHQLGIAKASARAMNRERVVVGSFGPNPEAQRAFVWDRQHGLRDLNAMIPAELKWKLEVASGINDRGDIIGWGDRGREENVGFLLRVRGSEASRHRSGGTK